VGCDGDVARVGCLAPEVLTHARAGERILFDDGKLAGTIERAGEEGLLVRIDRAPPRGATLRSDRGINLPDTPLALPFPSARDLDALHAIVGSVDLIALSFVHQPADIATIRRVLGELGRADVGIVLKIETRSAFERLPLLLFAALAGAPAGVMVARGDLAVEMGFERLTEVQEEILWMCEAAQLPCIWATQVLDSLARTGQPSRAEMTDAAMAARAECVMLNKGPFVIDAVHSLVDVLQRMDANQTKKRARLRRLAISTSGLG
jgi:pyruvate kinase